MKAEGDKKIAEVKEKLEELAGRGGYTLQVFFVSGKCRTYLCRSEKKERRGKKFERKERS